MNIAHRRYCNLPFPPYRYLPGRDPHPTANPAGHSYLPPGAPHPAITWHPPETWQESIDYLYGCDLYNHAYWWEAHEAWEGLWRVCPKPSVQRSFLQGLIQVSACQLKLLTGHFGGVERLRASSLDYLRSATDELTSAIFMGLNVNAFISHVEAYWRSRTTIGTQLLGHDPSEFPFIDLNPGTPDD